MSPSFHFRAGPGATLVTAVAIAMALAVPAFDAQGQTVPLPAAERPVHLLKAEYLACDRTSSRMVLSGGAVAYCSTVAEELLQRGFGGDFDRLIAWWRDARQAASAQR